MVDRSVWTRTSLMGMSFFVPFLFHNEALVFFFSVLVGGLRLLRASGRVRSVACDSSSRW